MRACGALLAYLAQTQMRSPEHLQRVSVYGFDEGLIAPVRGEPLAGLRGTATR